MLKCKHHKYYKYSKRQKEEKCKIRQWELVVLVEH